MLTWLFFLGHHHKRTLRSSTRLWWKTDPSRMIDRVSLPSRQVSSAWIEQIKMVKIPHLENTQTVTQVATETSDQSSWVLSLSSLMARIIQTQDSREPPNSVRVFPCSLRYCSLHSWCRCKCLCSLQHCHQPTMASLWMHQVLRVWGPTMLAFQMEAGPSSISKAPI